MGCPVNTQEEAVDMRVKAIVWVVLLAAALGMVACGGAPGPDAAQVGADESQPELVEQPSVEAAPPGPTEVVADEVAEPEPAEGAVAEASVEEAPPAEPALEPHIYRTAPASPGTFVSDQAQFVGATGSPQLIEFFTYW
jgi:hypothetical protein